MRINRAGRRTAYLGAFVAIFMANLGFRVGDLKINGNMRQVVVLDG